MVQLGFVFSELDNIKNQLKEAKADLKDALEGDEDFTSLSEKRKELGHKIALVKSNIKLNHSGVVSLIEELSSNLKSQKKLLADKTVADLAKGKNVEIKYKGFIYQPEFSVKYIKTDTIDDNENFFAK